MAGRPSTEFALSATVCPRIVRRKRRKPGGVRVRPAISVLSEGKGSEQRGTDQRWILHLLFGGNLLSSLEIAFATLFRLSFLCSISNFCDTVPLHTILCEFRSTNVNIKFPSGT